MEIVLAAEEELRHLPMPAIVFGLIGFGILLVMLVALLMFGKGRPHA